MINMIYPTVDGCILPLAGMSINITHTISSEHPEVTMMMLQLGIAVIAALVVGFLAGLLTFRIKQRWCTKCGATLMCTSCVHLPRTERRHAAAH